MVLLNFTNIVVDDFNYGKRNPLKRYVYFLTHCHSGEYMVYLRSLPGYFKWMELWTDFYVRRDESSIACKVS